MCRKNGLRPATAEEAKKLGVPPAYTDVLIADDPKADLIATARTPKGKTFYMYSASFRERMNRRKFKRVRALMTRIDKIEQRVLRDAQRFETESLATCARLIMLTGMRNGGESQGEKRSYGATSLLVEHCERMPDGIRFRFTGKHGVEQDYVVNDVVIYNWVSDRMASERVRLFDHDAGATLRYMKKLGCAKVHDLRTWRANVIAEALMREVQEQGLPESKKGKKQMVRFIAEQVASALGNKPGQALKSYIDPKVIRPLMEEE